MTAGPVLLVAPLAAFLTVFLLLNSLLSPRRNAIADKLRAYEYRSVAAKDHLSGSFVTRVLMPALEAAGRLAGAAAPGLMEDKLRVQLEQAGNPISVHAFVALRAVSLVAPALGYLLVLVARRGALGLPAIAVIACLVVLGAYLPKRWLSSRIAKRQKQIQKKLPDALDLIVVSMEAGLALDGAMAKVVERTRGALQEEIHKTLQEIHLGKPRREALRQLGVRTGVKDLIAVIGSIVQADQMGVSMAQTMRIQSDEARVRRRQRAEEKAHQAAVKMLIPLVLFILPSVMIVTIGPAAITIYKQFSSGIL